MPRYTVQAEGGAGIIKEKFAITVIDNHTPRIFVTPVHKRRSSDDFTRSRSLSESSFVSSNEVIAYGNTLMGGNEKDVELSNFSSS